MKFTSIEDYLSQRKEPIVPVYAHSRVRSAPRI